MASKAMLHLGKSGGDGVTPKGCDAGRIAFLAQAHALGVDRKEAAVGCAPINGDKRQGRIDGGSCHLGGNAGLARLLRQIIRLFNGRRSKARYGAFKPGWWTTLFGTTMQR